MADPFISEQDVVDYLGRGEITDPGLVIAVDAACDICRTYAEITFNETFGETATLDGTGTDALLLPETPVTAAGTVTVNGDAVTDFVLGPNGTLFRKYDETSTEYPTIVWPSGRQNVVVTYDFGYSDAEFPRDVRMVALSVASRLVVQGPAIEESLGDSRVKYAAASTDLTAGEKAILRKYRQAS